MIVKTLVCLAVFVNGGCCARQEQFKYLSVKKEYETFSLLARLDGTYYQERCGDVDRPYTLFISIRPKNDEGFSIKNISLWANGEKPVFEIASPEMQTELGIGSKRFFFIEIPNLDIGYEEYRVEFEVFRDGSFVEKVECFFKKDYSSRYTTRWLEAINSI
jgi:hypothetical protein